MRPGWNVRTSFWNSTFGEIVNLRNSIIWCGVVALQGVFGQSISLPGTIAIQNSKYVSGTRQFVSGASIRAPFAKAVSSDVNGAFRMEFVGVENGNAVRFTVAKPGLVVVNSKEMDHVVLGRIPELLIVMADPDELAQMQARYYDVAQASVQRSFQRGLSALRDTTLLLTQRLARFNAEAQDSVSTLHAAMEQLELQRERAMEQIGAMAHELALVDLDLASDRYRRAHEAMLRGDMDDVLVLLDPTELDADMALAVDQRATGTELMERAGVAIRQVVDGYQLKAQVLGTRFDHRGMLLAHQEILHIVREQSDLFDAQDEAEALLHVAVDLNSGGDRNGAIALVHEALQLTRSVPSVPRRMLASLHLELATILLDASRYAAGIAHADSALFVLAEDASNEPELVVQVHMTKGALLNKIGGAEQALTEFRSALLLTGTDPNGGRRSQVETSMGHSLMLTGAYDSAFVHVERGLRLAEASLSPDDPRLANAYEMFNGILSSQGKFKEALDAARQALTIRLRTMDPMHPMIKHTHGIIGKELQAMGDVDGAIAEFTYCLKEDPAAPGEVTTDRAESHLMMGELLGQARRFPEAGTHMRGAVEMAVQLYGPGHQNTASGYNTIGVNFWRMGMRDSALVYYRRALGIWRSSIGEENHAVGLLYGNMATALSQGGSYDEAMAMDRRALAILVPIVGNQHPDVANVYQSMGMINTRTDVLDSAVHYLDLAYTAYAATFGAGNLQAVVTRQSAALYRARAGRGAEAVRMAEEGIATMRAGPDAESALMVDWYIRFAQILAANKEYERAISVHHEALELIERIPAAKGRLGFGHAALAKTLYDSGAYEPASKEIELAIATAPASYMYWYAHLIAMQFNERTKALDHGASCLRLRASELSPFVKQGEEARAAVGMLARELDRKDLLQEFGLE